VRVPDDLEGLTQLLMSGGFVAADEEAAELLAAADGDREQLEAMVARRQTGEPLAWITGTVEFCGRWLRVDEGVYVPRWQSEPLARRAVERLPSDGVAIDLCTGCGAIAATLSAERPGARVVASDIDARSVANARANGVEAYEGDLFAPLPQELLGRVDVVAGVVPYVPTPGLERLQRDTFTFETPLAYDGGPDGTDILRRVLVDARAFLAPGGALLLEVGGSQNGDLNGDLTRLGYVDASEIVDEYGDLRGIEATR
jgi:release factor glutamine methyltransferase